MYLNFDGFFNCKMARVIPLAKTQKMIAIMTTVTNINTRLRVTTHLRVQLKGRPLRIRYTGRYPLGAFGILPVGVVMCVRAVEHDEVTFSDISVAVPWRERLAQ